MALITDATLQGIAQQLQLRNELYKGFVRKYGATTWDAVQLNVKSGHAADIYNVGDELVCKYNYEGAEYDFAWVIAGFRDVTWQDNTVHPGMVLQAMHCTIESIMFDAPEDTEVDLSTEAAALEGWHYWGKTGSNYTALNLSAGDTIPDTYDSVRKCGVNNLDVLRYGYNRYMYSAARQWLNSSADKNLWWAAAHLGDKAPTQLSTYKGFMAGLDEDFLAVINPIKVQAAANAITDGGVTDTMFDRFWLPSIEEVYGVPQASGVEGAYFQYWKDVTGLDAPSNAANNGRIITPINGGSGQYVRLRSCNRVYASSVWCVYTAGSLITVSNASGAFRLAPACAIS